MKVTIVCLCLALFLAVWTEAASAEKKDSERLKRGTCGKKKYEGKYPCDGKTNRNYGCWNKNLFTGKGDCWRSCEDAAAGPWSRCNGDWCYVIEDKIKDRNDRNEISKLEPKQRYSSCKTDDDCLQLSAVDKFCAVFK